MADLKLDKEKLAKKYIDQGVNSRDAPILTTLENLFDFPLWKISLDALLNEDIYHEEFYQARFFYEINDDGYVKSLSMGGFEGELLQFIPEQICYLRDIEELDLSVNSIRAIPELIGNLTSLKYLDLTNNYIQNVPESLGELKSLRFLDLACNKIAKIPESIYKSKSIKYFSAAGNDRFGPFPMIRISINDAKKLMKKPEKDFYEVYHNTNTHTCGEEIIHIKPYSIICPKCQVELKLWEFGIIENVIFFD